MGTVYGIGDTRLIVTVSIRRMWGYPFVVRRGRKTPPYIWDLR